MMAAGVASAGMSLAGGLEGLFGNSGNQAQPQNVNLGGITSNLNSQIPQLGQYNLGGQNLSQYQNTLQGTLNNPYAQLGQQGANWGAGVGMANAWQGAGNASTLGAGVNPLMNAAFDPQNALYNRTANQVGQQSLAGLEGSGLAQTPWGQGVYGNTMSNFNIDWQNNELSRMESGSGAATALGQGALGLGQNSAQGMFSSGMMPYGAYNTMGTNALSSLQNGAQYGISAANIPQTGIGDWLSYLGGANQANQVGNQTQQQNFNQNQIYGSQVGAGLQGLGGVNWAGMFGGQGGGVLPGGMPLGQGGIGHA